MAKIRSYKRVVIKIGTGVLTKESGSIDEQRVKKIVEQIVYLKKQRIELVVVSSGAIGAGMGVLGFTKRPELLPELQACAAVGQVKLINMYERFMTGQGYHAGQVLLTQDGMNDRKRYLNARNTILSLLKRDVIPVINENDAVSTEEIKFGDNDRLSSLVATLVGADRLVILSDVEGLYRFERGGVRRLITKVERITGEIESCAVTETGKFGTGGMQAKIQAAKIATQSGIECVLIDGKSGSRLKDLFDGKETGTVFLPTQARIKGKKKWIAHSSKACGSIIVDVGARDALVDKKRSLLSSGIVDISGRFDIGDVVSVSVDGGSEFARGLTNYSSSEIGKIKRLKSHEIEKVLGYKYYDEVVHRDNLVIL